MDTGIESAEPVVVVRARDGDDDEFVRATLTGSRGSPGIVVNGYERDALALPALVAEYWGRRVGLLSYDPQPRVHPAVTALGFVAPWEIVTLDALEPGVGVGTGLVECLADHAQVNGADAIWLITTNDNVVALRFYQRRGFDLVAVDRDAVVRARRSKPSIPMYSDGISIRHELVLARTLA